MHEIREIPKPWTVWEHTSGEIYIPFMLTNMDSDRPDYPKMVHYFNRKGNVFSKPLSDWHRSRKELVGAEPPPIPAQVISLCRSMAGKVPAP